MKITDVSVYDVRFPTSRTLAGSDAMHTSPDYSAAYVILKTDGDHAGHGLAFTNGRGTEVVTAGVRALAPLVIGRSLEGITADMRSFWRSLVSDDQLRWLGPEKGVMHMATAAVVNAVWDLRAKVAGVPVWQLLAEMSPEELVSTVDFRYIDDVLTPEEAIELLRVARPGGEARRRELIETGYPAYTTSAGWLGYDDEKVRSLVRLALDEGFRHVKMKVGQDLATDTRRAHLIRDVLGDATLMMDANQIWGVDEAVSAMRDLAQFDPWWIEEPTSPDDVLGHARIRKEVAPIAVATGEHVQNRVLFKQLFQAGAIDICQIDACRVGGLNEVIAILLLAAKFGVPVCPHAGGVGLCEYVQHIAIFDYISVSTSLDGRVVEWVDHLHEHFVHPASVSNGRYLVPMTPGYSIEMRTSTLEAYAYPTGAVWTEAMLVDS
ncbi:MAG: enolase C-terminal domain-like protein [Gaiellaceae bacterium]